MLLTVHWNNSLPSSPIVATSQYIRSQNKKINLKFRIKKCKNTLFKISYLLWLKRSLINKLIKIYLIILLFIWIVQMEISKMRWLTLLLGINQQNKWIKLILNQFFILFLISITILVINRYRKYIKWICKWVMLYSYQENNKDIKQLFL